MHSFMFTFSNYIGILGVILVLVAYFLLQLNKMSGQSLTFSMMNAVGSILILVSLCYHLNIASLVIEIAWLLISLFGICRVFFYRR